MEEKNQVAAAPRIPWCACRRPDDADLVHGVDMCWRPCRGECGGWVNPSDGLCYSGHPLNGDRVKARRAPEEANRRGAAEGQSEAVPDSNSAAQGEEK